ncbi:MAG: hypothetical protein L6V93_11945 [Clostridiales bacterium]|nr:MAG: hypothetical protein L6V93_11945 [Clostridiales bacterium]
MITFVVGIILNKGTNFIFGEISFVSNSVTAVLQLALSLDYAIILIHHYSEERERCDQHDAVVRSLAKINSRNSVKLSHHRIGDLRRLCLCSLKSALIWVCAL